MTHYSTGEGRLDIFLEEMNVIPEEFKTNSLLSKSFLIPLRNKIFQFVVSKFVYMLNVEVRVFNTKFYLLIICHTLSKLGSCTKPVE